MIPLKRACKVACFRHFLPHQHVVSIARLVRHFAAMLTSASIGVVLPAVAQMIAAGAPSRTAHGHASTPVLGLAALGVVFGDIGTSPLYVMRTVFTLGDGAIALTNEDIVGVVSCIIWILLIIVTFKYVGFVLRADHDGVGGILALSTLVRRFLKPNTRSTAAVAALGAFGAALFFGDSVITPAISVMSSVEGLKVAFPTMPNIVVPVSLVILAALFYIQRIGTAGIGRVFGPVMLAWFLALAAMGIPHVVSHPGILLALSPIEAMEFVSGHPGTAFIALGAIVLAVSGAEALYADVSHFGRQPIQATWIVVVLPALILNYLGQGALLIVNPEALANPFFMLVTSGLTVPLVVLATLATLIASQAVISGAYSNARQATRLGYLPHMKMVHTSPSASGQIYVPAVNGLLFCAVALVVVVFGGSEHLSAAYGLAISMDFVITSTLMLILTRTGWKWPLWKSALFWVGLSLVEWPILAANITKLVTGGWLPLSIALVMFFVMRTWHRGEQLVWKARTEREGSLVDFLADLEKHPVRRIPGTAIYPHSMISTTPVSLKLNTEINRTLHDHVVIVSIKSLPTPYAPKCDRVSFDKLDTTIPGIIHVTIKYGFMDRRNLETALLESKDDLGWRTWNLDKAWFMLSHLNVLNGPEPSMMWFRKRVFIWLTRVSASPPWTMLLPCARTTEISTRLTI